MSAATAATLLLMRHAGRAQKARDRGDWITYADARTSCDDAREALRAATKEKSC